MIDSAWYWVRYDSLSGRIEAPAQYNEAARAFYSVSFSGIPCRQVEILAPVAGPASPSREQLAALIEGMSVSVDVSTGDHDAGHRYFGTVTEVMENNGDKHGVKLLVQEPEPNFKPSGNEQKALAALRYYNNECTGHEPSLSVFQQMADEALKATPQTEPLAWMHTDTLEAMRQTPKAAKTRWPVHRLTEWDSKDGFTPLHIATQAQPAISPGDRMTLVGAAGLLAGHGYQESSNALQRVLEADTSQLAEPLCWVNEDELPESLPTEAYNRLFPFSKVDTVRMFPIFAPLAQPADPIRLAVRDYHYALDTRQHGGVAADKAIKAIERVLDMPWQQGAEAAQRVAAKDGEA
ncbi:hypothetical protein [Tardiphaga sp. 862_B3_N1_1]|uniref:hypothetical protein n=1 Tax=Tardiphaga sp. 862_B3_N1_1 TaxID=3240763 RepID=UPI003F8AF361